ncbi:MAG: 2-oxo acid dehydrogenase subunit E2, partial [Methylocystis sp.]
LLRLREDYNSAAPLGAVGKPYWKTSVYDFVVMALAIALQRKPEAKSVREISDEIKELAGRARARKLKPHEYEGGVSAVSNLGMYGIKSFTAVINPPQSTILAVGQGEQRMIVKDGAPVVATLMSVTLSCDHRAVDGALGAELLAEFKHIVEHPAMMFA